MLSQTKIVKTASVNKALIEKNCENTVITDMYTRKRLDPLWRRHPLQSQNPFYHMACYWHIWYTFFFIHRSNSPKSIGL